MLLVGGAVCDDWITSVGGVLKVGGKPCPAAPEPEGIQEMEGAGGGRDGGGKRLGGCV